MAERMTVVLDTAEVKGPFESAKGTYVFHEYTGAGEKFSKIAKPTADLEFNAGDTVEITFQRVANGKYVNNRIELMEPSEAKPDGTPSATLPWANSSTTTPKKKAWTRKTSTTTTTATETPKTLTGTTVVGTTAGATFKSNDSVQRTICAQHAVTQAIEFLKLTENTDATLEDVQTVADWIEGRTTRNLTK